MPVHKNYFLLTFDIKIEMKPLRDSNGINSLHRALRTKSLVKTSCTDHACVNLKVLRKIIFPRKCSEVMGKCLSIFPKIFQSDFSQPQRDISASN